MRFDDLLALSFIEGVGVKTLKKILQVECVADLLLMDDKELKCYIPNQKTIELFKTNFDFYRQKAQLARRHLKDNGATLISYENSIYPEKLRASNDGPMFLYCVGNLDLLNSERSAAISGPREASETGLKTAFNTARDLASRDITVISGLARGIDTAAHNGALPSGNTIAVLPFFSPVYPPENKSLAQRILNNGGLIVAENYEPQNVKFQLLSRDKITINLCDNLYIPDMYRSDSGTSYTVDYARANGKAVYVNSNGKYIKLNESLE